MAFKKVNTDKQYTKYAQSQPGDIVAEGVFIGKGTDNFGRPTYEFKNEETGAIQVANSAGHVNYLMRQYVSVGDYCRIIYDGKIKLEKGPMQGRESHTFTLEIDNERYSKVAAEKYSEELDGDESASSENTDAGDGDMTL